MIGFEFLASVAPILALRGLRDRRDFTRVSGVEISDGISTHEIFPDVRIWYVPHGSRDIGANYSATLTPADLEEFALIRDEEKRGRSQITRAVLRKALSEAVGNQIAPRTWQFGRTEMGKPILVSGPKTLSFSCSHTEQASIIAVSATRKVGIDIEAGIFSASARWLSDTFTRTELELINVLPASDRNQAVARLWTLKEAYLKMIGTGIADPLEVAFDPRSDRLLSGQQDRRAATSFETWIANCQGQPLSVAVAISEPTTKGASWRQSIEECRVRLRAKFISPGKRADEGTALTSPLLRDSGAAAA